MAAKVKIHQLGQELIEKTSIWEHDMVQTHDHLHVRLVSLPQHRLDDKCSIFTCIRFTRICFNNFYLKKNIEIICYSDENISYWKYFAENK